MKRAALLLIPAVLACAGAAFLGNPPPKAISAFGTSIEGRTKSQRYNAVRALRKLNGATIAPGGG